MHSDFTHAFRSIRPSIVGLGLSIQGGIQIIGTGFLISDTGWILTNRHVLEPFLVEVEGAKGVSSSALAVLFTNADPESFMGAIGVMGTPIERISFQPDQPPKQDEVEPTFRGLKPTSRILPRVPDIGLCKISPDRCHPSALPLKSSSILRVAKDVGSPVGILGFPQGLHIPMDLEFVNLLQFTPILQCGNISAALPFAGLSNPETYVLDIFVNAGSSGSPLFNLEGQVIGVVYATRQSFEPLVTRGNDEPVRSMDSGVYIPSALGLAVPATRLFPDWFEKVSGITIA